MVLKRTEMFVFVVGHYARSPRIRLANWISLGMIVTCLGGWHTDWYLRTDQQGRPLLLPVGTISPLIGTADLSCSLGRSLSLTSGRAAYGMRSTVLFWKWQISRRAAVPAWYLCGFTSLPCILASCIFCFCTWVQSSIRIPNSVLSLL